MLESGTSFLAMPSNDRDEENHSDEDVVEEYSLEEDHCYRH